MINKTMQVTDFYLFNRNGLSSSEKAQLLRKPVIKRKHPITY